MNSIDTIFEWLLAAALRASVLAVAIVGIQFALRRWLPAGWRHALWLPMLAVLVLPVLPEAPFGLFPPTTAEATHVAANPAVPVAIMAPVPEVSGSAVVVAALEPAFVSPVPSTSSQEVAVEWNVFAIAWLAGACGVLAAGVIGYRRNMRRIRMNATSPDEAPRLATELADLRAASAALVQPAALVRLRKDAS